MSAPTMKDEALDAAYRILRRIRDNPKGQPWAWLDLVIAKVRIARTARPEDPAQGASTI